MTTSKWFKLTTSVVEISAPPDDITQGTLPDGSVLVQANDANGAVEEFKTTDLSNPIVPMYRVSVNITKGTVELLVPASTSQAAAAAATSLFNTEVGSKISGVEYSLSTPVREY